MAEIRRMRDSVVVVNVAVDSDLLTIDTVAQHLGVHEHTVRAYIAEGRLRAVRIGGKPRGQLRILRSDLEAALHGWEERRA